ncbi:MFS transporter [Picrophilus oshimae]|uniref:Transporter n=1 Tax=Picrophilus torridus (strain ATCC 700027 / DSM 9790 / JCM 10055 / NBRC 100828 / KAW 2/3) TaxID=1122961 RepID=Q6L2W6_PICTO|nr:MFS transporter [Picrophilus oshimae]AAT42685.1 transporter [Picrophilus oshimae DSM 9789]
MLSRNQRFMLLSSSASFTIWGIIATIGPLAASGAIIHALPLKLKVIILLIGPIFAPLGNFTMGLLTDILGRKRVFIMTMSLYGIGVIIIAFSYVFYTLLIGLVLAEFGVGGEEMPSLSLIAEDSPLRSRAKWLTIVSDFNNIGSAIITGLFLIVYTSIMDRYALLVSAFILIVIMVIARVNLPESFRWLNSRGRFDAAKVEEKKLYIDSNGTSTGKISGGQYLGRFLFLAAIGISQYITFGLMAYVIGPYEFPSTYIDEMIIFVALLGASAAGFIAAPLISRGRKVYTAYSYIGGFISTLIILFLVPYLRNMFIFLPLLFINMMMSEFGWASRTTLEPELFPTRYRGTFMGIVRLAPMIGYAISVDLTSTFTLYQFILYNVILWLLGAVASVLWLIKGNETRDINIDYA